jgi:hypothetical protein
MDHFRLSPTTNAYGHTNAKMSCHEHCSITHTSPIDDAYGLEERDDAKMHTLSPQIHLVLCGKKSQEKQKKRGKQPKTQMHKFCMPQPTAKREAFIQMPTQKCFVWMEIALPHHMLFYKMNGARPTRDLCISAAGT